VQKYFRSFKTSVLDAECWIFGRFGAGYAHKLIMRLDKVRQEAAQPFRT
jgi:hypothetical protein